MCECGCSIGNPAYRLPINARSCYVIELYPGCENCVAAPGIIVRKIDSKSFCWDEIQEYRLFPLTKCDGDDYTEGAICVGLDCDEFRKEAVGNMIGTEVVLANIIAEDIWKSAVRRMPEVIDYSKPGKIATEVSA